MRKISSNQSIIKVLALLMILVLAVAGCGSDTDTSSTSDSSNSSDSTTTDESASDSEEATSSTSDTIVVRASGDPLSWNPDVGADDNLYEIAQNMFVRLAKLDADKEVIPDLAQSWEWSDDNLTLTFHLTEGYTWSDGEPLTSEDVKYTFDYIKENSDTYFNSNMSVVDSIECPDDYTVVFNMNSVDVSFVSLLAWYGTFIMPEHVYNVDGLAWGDNDAAKTTPVTAGAYTLDDYVVGERISLKAADNSYIQAKTPNLVFSIIADDDTAVQALINGEIDLLESMPNSYYDELNANPEITLTQNRYPSPIRLVFNMNDDTVSDLAVRQAIAYTIDREDISNKATAGIMLPEYAFYPSMMEWASNQDDLAPDQDLEKAEQILIDAGYTKDSDGYYIEDLSLKVFSGSTYEDTATLIASACQSIGINMTVETTEYNAWQEAVYSGDFAIEMQGGFMGPDPNALKTRFTTDGSSNLGFYSNPEFDELIEKGATVSDQEERVEYYYAAQTILSEDLPYIPILEYDSYDASYSGLKDLPDDGAGQWGWQEFAYAYFE